MALNSWKKLLDALKASGASLVFFADLSLQEGKIDAWLRRRNEKFDFYKSVYELIGIGASVESIVAVVKDTKGLTTTFYGMEVIAQAYGDFNRSVKHECDLELAQYATRNNAMAVISNDTDFLIFDGPWRLWSSNDIQISKTNQVTVIEYNRNGIANICSLSKQELPLFATLVGNDFTKYEQMVGFHRSLGPMQSKFKNIARYVRDFGGVLSDSKLEQMSRRIFYGDDQMLQLIKQSVASYKTDFPPPTIDDPLERKLLKTNMYRPYVSTMCPIQGITMPFYDMHSYDSATSFPVLLTEWLKRKIGVLRNKNNDDAFTFNLLAKKSINQCYRAYEESPIYPDCKRKWILVEIIFDLQILTLSIILCVWILVPIPPLDQLYLGNKNGNTDDTNTLETKWKILGWIMSLNDELISKLKLLPKEYLLISAILYALVKVILKKMKYSFFENIFWTNFHFHK